MIIKQLTYFSNKLATEKTLLLENIGRKVNRSNFACNFAITDSLNFISQFLKLSAIVCSFGISEYANIDNSLAYVNFNVSHKTSKLVSRGDSAISLWFQADPLLFGNSHV